MSTWVVQPELRTVMYAPIGLRLVDDLTGQRPSPLRLVERLSGPTRGTFAVTLLERLNGDLRPTGIAPILTPGGVVTYPALGRTADPATAPARHYEIRIEADRYRPLYRATSTGVGFTAFPYDDERHPPSSHPRSAEETRLVPSAAYPFPNHLVVLRGQVVDGGSPVADALVSVTVDIDGNQRTDRTLSDDDGRFALPLRWVETGVTTMVTAVSQPPLGSGRTGAIDITLPDALTTEQKISLT